MEKIDIAKVQFFTKVIGSLALIKAFLKKMQIAKIVDEICPSDPQQKVSHGKVVELLRKIWEVSPNFKFWWKEGGI